MPNARRGTTKKAEPAEPQAAPAVPKKQVVRRPRIDGIIHSIVRGDYDDKLSELKEAIAKRNEARKEAVLAQVREVWGEDADVVFASTEAAFSAERENPFKKHAAETVMEESTEDYESPLSAQELSGLEAHSPGADGAVQITPNPDEPSFDEGGIVSHSPNLS